LKLILSLAVTKVIRLNTKDAMPLCDLANLSHLLSDVEVLSEQPIGINYLITLIAKYPQTRPPYYLIKRYDGIR
jgi:hypothetical protein